MSDFPYVVNANTLKVFLQKIPTIGKPEKLTVEVLASLGFKSSNDRRIGPVLKFLGFVSSDGSPTEQWVAYRDKSKSGAVLAGCIKAAYADLFTVYPDAQNKDVEALRNFFSTHTTGGESVLRFTVGTFRGLCELADFGAQPIVITAPSSAPVPTGQGTWGIGAPVQTAPTKQGFVINLNIELQLPATNDASIYDKIFESLRKHLLEQQS
jgi:hypothetical protein